MTMSNTQPIKQSAAVKSEQKNSQPRRPNEQGSFSVEAHFKIFDPKTREVYVEGRA